MSRIATKFLDDPMLSESELASHVAHFANTPSTGGTAIEMDGTIYLSGVDKKQVLKISPEGKVSTPFTDPRLIWLDAMWIDDHGNLLLPVAQLTRTADLNGGKDTVSPPITPYRHNVGLKRVRE